jgi:hypothetical protein
MKALVGRTKARITNLLMHLFGIHALADCLGLEIKLLTDQQKRTATMSADALVATVALEKFFNAKFVDLMGQLRVVDKTLSVGFAAGSQFYRDQDKRNGTTSEALEQIRQVVTHGEASAEEKLDRLLMLLEPQAQKLHRKAPSVPDWDQVQAENLKQLDEENNRGKSVRK